VPVLHWLHAFDNDSEAIQPITEAGNFQGDILDSFWRSNLPSDGLSSWVIATYIPEPSTSLMAAVFLFVEMALCRRSTHRKSLNVRLMIS
jgi:hypothetical protein